MTSWLLHLGTDFWNLTACDEDGEEIGKEYEAGTLDEQIGPIIEVLRGIGAVEAPLIIGLDARMCLSTTIEVSSPQMLRKPDVLHYQLEEWLPWSAEECVSDYLPHRNQAFVVAVRHEELSDLLKALQKEDFQVIALVPVALLALQQHLAEANLPKDRLLIWQQQDVLELFTISQGELIQWNHIPAKSTELIRNLRLVQLNGTPLSIHTRGLTQDLQIALQDERTTHIEESCEFHEAASQICTRIAKGEIEPILNLQKRELANQHRHRLLVKQLRFLKLSAAILLLCLGTAHFWRASQFAEATEEVQGQLNTLYQDLYPDKALPSQVGKALTAELKTLQGTREPSAQLPQPSAADLLLERVLRHLPGKMRFRIPEIHLEENRLSMRGEVRSNADADRLASALRKAGFEVDAPRTQRLVDQGFTVRLTARLKGPAEEESKTK